MTLLVIQSYDKATAIKTVFLVQGGANRPVQQKRGHKDSQAGICGPLTHDCSREMVSFQEIPLGLLGSTTEEKVI